jgi:hypothetical protein
MVKMDSNGVLGQASFGQKLSHSGQSAYKSTGWAVRIQIASQHALYLGVAAFFDN